MPQEKIMVTDEEDMHRFAARLAAELRPGDVVALNGNLGAGKTFLVKAVAAQWGITAAASPTFAIVNQYHGTRKVYHFDFYRINAMRELTDIGFQEYLADADAVVFVEWAELFPEMLPPYAKQVYIQLNDDFCREVTYAAS